MGVEGQNSFSPRKTPNANDLFNTLVQYRGLRIDVARAVAGDFETRFEYCYWHDGIAVALDYLKRVIELVEVIMKERDRDALLTRLT